MVGHGHDPTWHACGGCGHGERNAPMVLFLVLLAQARQLHSATWVGPTAVHCGQSLAIVLL